MKHVMIFSTIKNWWRTVICSYRILRVDRELFRWLFIAPFFHVFIFVTLKLDYIFFPKFITKKISKPVFIITPGRSGTTFLHRFLNTNDDFVNFKGWEIMIPSLTGRKLLWPWLNWRLKNGRTLIMPKKTGHLSDLRLVEEEEALLMHAYQSYFSWSNTPLGLDLIEYPDLTNANNTFSRKVEWKVRYLARMFKRQMYSSGRSQILAKSTSMTMGAFTLLRCFPDTKFIYISRSPYDVVSSRLSMAEQKCHSRFGANKVPKDRVLLHCKRHYDNTHLLYKQIYKIRDMVEPENFLIISYNDFFRDFRGTMDRIEQFIGVEFSDKLREAIQEQKDEQKTYEREHEVKSVSDFGISKEQIAKDFDFILQEEQRYNS